jgi:hypothetical protein
MVAGCTSPETSLACRTVIVATNKAEVFTFFFRVETYGGDHQLVQNTVNITCSEAVEIYQPS